jgi:hypothetical protein
VTAVLSFLYERSLYTDMLYTMSVRYETGTPFNTGAGGGTADYAFAMMFAMVVMLARCVIDFHGIRNVC